MVHSLNIEHEKLDELEKLFLIYLLTAGDYQSFEARVKEFFETTPYSVHEMEISKLLLSFLGGENMIKYSKLNQDDKGVFYNSSMYKNFAIIFDNFVKRDGLWLSDIREFMNKATEQLKTYCDKYHRYSGLGQFEYQLIDKMYVSILRHVRMNPTQRLYFLALLCDSLHVCDTGKMRWYLREFIADQYLLITEKVLKPTKEQREMLKDKAFNWFWDREQT